MNHEKSIPCTYIVFLIKLVFDLCMASQNFQNLIREQTTRLWILMILKLSLVLKCPPFSQMMKSHSLCYLKMEPFRVQISVKYIFEVYVSRAVQEHHVSKKEVTTSFLFGEQGTFEDHSDSFESNLESMPCGIAQKPS